MESLRLPPLKFDALPNPNNTPLHCELPPISLHPSISSSSPYRHTPQHSVPPPPQPSQPHPSSYPSPSSSSITSHHSNSLLPSVSPRLLQNRHHSSVTSSIPIQKMSIAKHHCYSSKLSSSPTSSSSSVQPTPSASLVIHSLLNPVDAVYTHASVQHAPTHIYSPTHNHSHISDYHNPKTAPTEFNANHTLNNSLPPNAPIAPVKRAIQTPKGIREVYTCPFPTCNRISSEHSNMKAHMRLHTGERPYVCRVASCRKSFRWKSSLTYHERALHSNSRPYQCISCRKSFVEKRKLRLHHQLCPAIRATQAQAINYAKSKAPLPNQTR